MKPQDQLFRINISKLFWFRTSHFYIRGRLFHTPQTLDRSVSRLRNAKSGKPIYICCQSLWLVLRLDKLIFTFIKSINGIFHQNDRY